MDVDALSSSRYQSAEVWPIPPFPSSRSGQSPTGLFHILAQNREEEEEETQRKRIIFHATAGKVAASIFWLAGSSTTVRSSVGYIAHIFRMVNLLLCSKLLEMHNSRLERDAFGRYYSSAVSAAGLLLPPSLNLWPNCKAIMAIFPIWFA